MVSTFLFGADVAIDTMGINLGKGYTDHDITNRTGTIQIPHHPYKNYTGLEMYSTLSGVFEEKDIKPYLSLTYLQNSDIKHKYILGGVNKYFKADMLDYYVGVVGGYGQIDWQYNPITNTRDNKYDAKSFIGGVQGGAAYPLSQKLSLQINTKYLLHNYETKLEPSNDAQSTLTHDKTLFVGIGLSWKFTEEIPKQNIEEKPIETIQEETQKTEETNTSYAITQEVTQANTNEILKDSDSDNDGVIDKLDKCPDTPNGARVDTNGCEIDFNILIYFSNNSAIIDDIYIQKIKDLADFLTKHQGYKIKLIAHTDSKGSDAYNMKLSYYRAKALYNELLKYAIEPTRMAYAGAGEQIPIASNETQEGKALNRRIEIQFIYDK